MAANKKLSGSSSSDFLEIFEKYKAAMQKEMMSMRKNMTFVLQENNQLKSQILESNKKEGHYQQIEQQFQQLKKETAEYANSVNAKQSKTVQSNQLEEEEFTHMLVENRTLKSQKPLLNYVLQETIKKLKKKKNSLENALDMLSPEDLQSVLEVYDSLELKWKFKLEG